MSASYRAVNWNRQKLIYDGLLAAGVATYLLLFGGITLLRDGNATLETALIRGLGTGALLLLTVILAIGPLARLDPRFLPLLYNRRHLGVTMCLLALAHGGFALIQFHALGDVHPLVSLLTAAADPASPEAFPFELAGLAALLILLLMAATSHDFWLATLSPPLWKALHMLVYVAYGLLIAHVALGDLQQSGSRLPAVLLIGSATVVFGLHLVAGRREGRRDRQETGGEGREWIEVCTVDDIREHRARLAVVGGERIAVFRHEGKVSAVSNVCSHQNGPLGEGKIVDGCITCPWHGYQYLPDSGQSPPPFTEKIPTYAVRVTDGRVLVDPRPNPPGTRVEPARIAATAMTTAAEADPFYVGYHPAAPAVIGRATLHRVLLLTMLALGTAVLLAAKQERAAPGVFEYGRERRLRGQIREFPYPSLLVPAESGEREAAYTRYLLVSQGKHGAQHEARGMDGQWAELTGTRIARPEREMLELLPAGVTLTPPAPDVRIPPPASLGQMVLSGEIVDSKCWLGVMKPATGTVHRGCATRCLSGGIPPLLMTTDSTGTTMHLLLTGADGEPAHQWLKELVGRRVTVSGEVIRDGDLLLQRVREVVVVGD